VKFAVYNLLNQQRVVRVDQELQPTVGLTDPDANGVQHTEYNQFFGQGYGFQSPRYAQLVVSLTF
jgi:hypothetical protein